MTDTKRYFDVTLDEVPDDIQEFKGRTVPVDREVIDRLIQEEIWAQTLWPEGEPTLAEIIKARRAWITAS